MNTVAVKPTTLKQLNNSATNPISNSPSISEDIRDRIFLSMESIIEILDNTTVEEIIKDEFGRNIPELALLVKERLFIA